MGFTHTHTNCAIDKNVVNIPLFVFVSVALYLLMKNKKSLRALHVSAVGKPSMVTLMFVKKHATTPTAF